MRAIVAGAMAAALLAPATAMAAEPQPAGTTRRYTFTDPAQSGAYGGGSRDYLLHVPSRYRGRPAPILVWLHGCDQSAEDARVQTRLEAFADRVGALVAFPEQNAEAYPLRCWNWQYTIHQQRDGGEAALIAGITRQVMEGFAVDPARVYVAGLSAGGAMSVIMGAAYPDLYAAIAVHAGCAYRGWPCFYSPVTLPAATTGQWAYEAMGPRARPIPVFALVGDGDTTTPPENTELVVGQWLHTNDLADDGAANGSVPGTPASTKELQQSGRRPVTLTSYVDGAGCLLQEHWVVHGMGHAYSGGDPSSAYSDPLGMDANAAMWRFFKSHPMRGGCA